jgi:hypothetical protein
MSSFMKNQAIQAMRFYIDDQRAKEDLVRPFHVYKDDLVYNMIGHVNAVAKAVIKLTAMECNYSDARGKLMKMSAIDELGGPTVAGEPEYVPSWDR